MQIYSYVLHVSQRSSNWNVKNVHCATSMLRSEFYAELQNRRSPYEWAFIRENKTQMFIVIILVLILPLIFDFTDVYTSRSISTAHSKV